MTKRATKDDWKTKPLSDRHTTLKLNRVFTPEEMHLITMGYIPEEMENKWFIFWEDGSLYFHRSWTGICMYVVHFKKNGDTYEMYEADINRDPEEYKKEEGEEIIDSINFLIDRLLLHRNVKLPKDNSDIQTTLENWSLYGSAMLEDDSDA